MTKPIFSSSLTSSQRFHFDVYGFVILESILDRAEVSRMRNALYRMRDDPEKVAKRIYVNSDKPHHVHMGNLVEYDSVLLEYAVHPKLLPLVEEVVGGSVRLEETEAILNSRNPTAPRRDVTECLLPLGFHTGTRHGWGTYMQHEKFHCIFVKTLAYLTDVGTGDGGTAVIPGSHKMAWPQDEMIEAALADPKRLIRQIEAPAGSVILFAESLIHSTTEILTDNERVILVAGYTPTMLREWPGNEISPEFGAKLPDGIRQVITGEESWHWRKH